MNLLITSAGRRSYIIDYFKACSGISNVYASNSEYSIALKRADKYIITPLIYSNEYIPTLIDFCKQNSVNAVISLFDIDVLVLAQNKHYFETNGVRLLIPDVNFVRKCNDKWECFRFLSSTRVDTPNTYLSMQDTISALENGEITFPIIIKPRWGCSSIGVYIADNIDELRILSIKCTKDIYSSYLKYESGITADNPIIYQEYIEGDEYGLDVLNDLSGNYINTFAKRKLSMRSGETDLGKTVSSAPFEPIGRTVSVNSRHNGLLSIDCIKNDDRILIIDMNCRISGHYPLSYLAGFNYPQLIVDWLNDKPTDSALLNFNEGISVIKDLKPTII